MGVQTLQQTEDNSEAVLTALGMNFCRDVDLSVVRVSSSAILCAMHVTQQMAGTPRR